jgi:DNA modification methylase
MPRTALVKQNSEYTFKYNMGIGRHGWLRLTPAYSVKLVNEILRIYNDNSLKVFDPFSGTGTTGIVASSKGHKSILNEINPFLVWIANQKIKNYTDIERQKIMAVFINIIKNIDCYINKDNWYPDIFNIDRWWNKDTLTILAAIRGSIVESIGEPELFNEYNLIWIAFCKIIIETSSASFNHISMSFKSEPIKYKKEYIINQFLRIMDYIIESTKDNIIGQVSIINSDSRTMEGIDDVDIVITSPPYPNRISYIRELRPYMYWLKFIESTTDSSDIDWKCIGGTWGAATSKLLTWKPETIIDFKNLQDTVKLIEKTNEKNSKLLSIYVYKYFYDMANHINKLYKVLNHTADIYYIIGNSTFFNVNVDSDDLYRKMFEMAGFSNISSKIIRKRNCNKKLYEYCIMANKNGGTAHDNIFYAPVYKAERKPATQAWLPFG